MNEIYLENGSKISKNDIIKLINDFNLDIKSSNIIDDLVNTEDDRLFMISDDDESELFCMILEMI